MSDAPRPDPRYTTPAVMVVTNPIVNVAILYNPLDPMSRTLATLAWGYKKPLSAYLEGLPERVHWAAFVNGNQVEKKDWETTFLNPEDYLVVMIVPEGGGGKSIFRLVAMLALTIVAPYLGAAIGLTGIALSLFTTAVTVVGGLILNAIFPPPKPKNSRSSDDESSASYGIDGPKNTATEDLPVPALFGTFRAAGNIVNIRTENHDDTQLLYMHMVVSEGEIESIDDIEIDNQPVTNFEEVTVEKRLGAANETMIGWFNDIYLMQNKSIVLDHENWTQHTTTQSVDKFRVDFVFPQGLMEINEENGDRMNYTVELAAEYRKQGDPDWIPLYKEDWAEFVGTSTGVDQTTRLRVEASYTTPGAAAVEPYTITVQYRPVGGGAWTTLGTITDTVTNGTRTSQKGNTNILPTTVTKVFESGALALDEYEIQVTSGTLSKAWLWKRLPISYTAAKRAAVRRSIESELLEKAVYEIRVKRITEKASDDIISDEVMLSDVAEILTEDVNYNNTASYALRVRLTDQLNRIPNVTALIKGIKCKTYDIHGNVVLSSTFTANAAWVTLEILTNTRWGAGLDPSRFVWPKWIEWAEYCEENGLTFNGTFDFETNVWEAVQSVMRVGHAQIVPMGTRYSVAIEKPALPSMMFSVSNMIEESFSIEWLPMEDRANEIEVFFIDKDDGYKRKPIRVVDYDALAKGRPQRVSSISMLGIVDLARAYREGYFLLAFNRYIRQTVTFDAPLEAIACTVGDVVYVQHDMPQWGYAGRLKSGSTTTVLNLDREMTMVDGKDYVALVHLPAVKRYDLTIASISGNSVFAAFGETPKVVRRLKKGALDIEILRVIEGSPNSEIVLEDTTGLSVSDAIELWDTDVIEERAVVNTDSTTDTITLTSALSQAPVEFANFMFGESTLVKKPFRVRSISGSHDYKRTLTLIEYNESVYDPPTAVPTPVYSDLDKFIDHVTINEVSEFLIKRNGVIVTRVMVEWTPSNTGIYQGAEVYVSRNNMAYESVGTVNGGATTLTFDATDGDQLKIRVIPFDPLGARPAFVDAPTWDHTVVGKTAKPANVTGFAATRVLNGVRFDWTLNPEVDVVGYEIREGANWSSATPVVEEYAGNSFTIAKNTGGTFTYLIRAVDVLGNYSENSASAQVTIGGPATVQNFNAVQSLGNIVLTWTPNTEQDLVGYEIREGGNWGYGLFVGRASGTSYSVPSNVPGTRTFWIKAYNSAGVYSATAVLASPAIEPDEDHNLVESNDEHADGYLGYRYRTELLSSNLILSTGYFYGEYIHRVALASSFMARNILITDFDAVVASSEDWDDATYTWESTEAMDPWEPPGDIESVHLDREISIYRGLISGETEGFPCNGSLTGIGSTAAAESTGVTYEDGRFADGVRINTGVDVSWDFVIPSSHTISMWVRPKALADRDWFVVSNASPARSIRVGWDNTNERFYCIGSDGNTFYVTGLVPAVDDLLLVTLVQTATDRKLFIGRTHDELVVSNQGAHAAMGAMDSLELHGSTADRPNAVFSDILVSNTDYDAAGFATQLDRGSAPGYNNFQSFVAGDYEYQYAIFRHRFHATTTDRPRLKALEVIVDLPDVFDRGEETTSASAVVAVSFNRVFHVAPEVYAQLKGGATFAAPRVSNVTTTGFDLELLDSGGSRVVGTASWAAHGY